MDSKRDQHGSEHPATPAHGHAPARELGHSPGGRGHYGRLAAMAGLSFIAMFVLMYAMVNAFSNVVININQFYMALLMTAPMVAIEIVLMSAMYHNRKLNLAIVAGSVVVLAACWFGIRKQAAVGDSQFLRSMIPHHGGALLMCEEASITDPRVKDLCERIRESQTREIAEMKDLLKDVK
jgi:hypothetical protein